MTSRFFHSHVPDECTTAVIVKGSILLVLQVPLPKTQIDTDILFKHSTGYFLKDHHMIQAFQKGVVPGTFTH